MADGAFREDLFYRINVIPITIPPLRERKEDTPVLATYFLDQLNKKYSVKKIFTQAALDIFQDYSWPGNVRELRNVVERIFAIISEDIITDEHIINVLGMGGKTRLTGIDRELPSKEIFPENTLYKATDQFQREYIIRVIQLCKGNVQQAARQMGIDRSGLYKKMDKLRIKL